MTEGMKEKDQNLLISPKGEMARDILKAVGAVGAVLTVMVFAPAAVGVSIKFLAELEQAIAEGRGYLYRYRIKRAINQLRQRRLVRVKELDDGFELRITTAGREIVKKLALDDLTIKPMDRWDGIWRIVGFDVPERDKPAREALRALLKRLGFYRLQKSVWIIPWPCRDEVDLIRAAYHLADNLWYCESRTLDREIELRKQFDLLTIRVG